MKAIYRGHSYFTKKRLFSHLANEKYKSQIKEKGPNYKVCLKIDGKNSGININKIPYKDWEWTVVVHKMKGSNQLIREQMEKAFDKKFSKPIKCIN